MFVKKQTGKILLALAVLGMVLIWKRSCHRECERQLCHIENETSDKEVYKQRFEKHLSKVQQYPQVILIGAKKCGTRAIDVMLQIHPAISGQNHEMHFFDWYFKKGFEHYLNEMAPSMSNQIVIEKSPSYFISEEVPKRMKEFNESLKLILIVRDPVERFKSDYLHERRHNTTLAKMTIGIDEVIQDPKHQALYKNLLEPSLFGKHFSRWLQYFDKQQILIIDGENLLIKPWEELQRVQDFLKLDAFFYSYNFHIHPETNFYCYVSQRKVKCLGKNKGNIHPNITQESNQILVSALKNDMHLFINISHCKFPWLSSWLQNDH